MVFIDPHIWHIFDEHFRKKGENNSDMQITIPLVKHGLGLFWLKAKNIPKIIWRDEITKGQKHLNWVLGNRFGEWGKIRGNK